MNRAKFIKKNYNIQLSPMKSLFEQYGSLTHSRKHSAQRFVRWPQNEKLEPKFAGSMAARFEQGECVIFWGLFMCRIRISYSFPFKIPP